VINSLKIDGFRGLRGVCLEPLGRVNVILGPGNSGKTNLLEAAFFFCFTGNPLPLYGLLGSRGVATDQLSQKEDAAHVDFWWSIGEEGTSFSITGKWENKERVNRFHRKTPKEIIKTRDTDQPEGGAIDNESWNLTKPLAVYACDTRIEGQEPTAGELRITPKGVNLKTGEAPPIPARFVSSTEQGTSRDLPKVWTEVEESGEEDSILQLLRQTFDHEIEAIRLAADDRGRAVLRIHHRTLGRIPIEVQGAGFRRALALAAYGAAARGGVLLVDEFDSSLHVGAQSQVIDFVLRSSAAHNVQLLTSTHSLETVDAFLHSFSRQSDLFTRPEDLRVIQLKRTGGRTVIANNLDSQRAKRMRDELGIDLRRVS
jgi:recombinational DNA repair ATPase RecF